jgi:hypothetical protein
MPFKLACRGGQSSPSATPFAKTSQISIPMLLPGLTVPTSNACWRTGTSSATAQKIEATIANARATVALRVAAESLGALIRAHVPSPRKPPTSWANVPATTTEAESLARELKRRGFRFLGPTTLYAVMQACGLVDDHIADCPARPAVERARRAAGLI